MLTRDFAAEETDEGFNVTYSDDPEPIFVAKFRLDPEVAEMIRSRVVPNDAPGHAFGAGIGGFALPAVLANAMPPTPMTQEEQDAVVAEQAAYTQASLANEGALESPAPPPPAMDGGMSGYAPLPGGGQSLPPDRMVSMPPVPTEPAAPIESTDPSLDVSMPPAQVYRSLLNTEAPPQPLGGVPQSGAGPFQTPYSPVPTTTGEQGAPPGIAAPSGQRSGERVKASSERNGAYVEPKGIGEPPVDQAQLERDSRAAVLAMLAGKAEETRQQSDLKTQEETLLRQQSIEKAYQDEVARRDIEAREMKRQIMEGKVDPSRLFSSMDGGRQAATLVSMVLGGLAQGASGFRTGNAAVEMFDRMIDRDIAAQKDNLDRKQSLYRDFLQEGRDAQQSYLLTKASMQEGLAAQLRLNATKLGSEMAMNNAEQSAIAIENAAKVNRDKASADWRKSKLDEANTYSEIAYRRSQAQHAKQMAEISRYDAETRRGEAEGKAAGGPGREYVVPVAPFALQGKQGVRFTAFNKEQANKVRAAGSNAEDLLAMLEDAKEFRRDRWSAWIPTWAGGDDAALADAFRARILGAINEQRDYGALDRGSQEVIGFEAIDPGSILKSDKTIFGVLDGVAKATQRGYMNMLRSQTEEGAAAIADSLRPAGGRRAGQ